MMKNWQEIKEELSLVKAALDCPIEAGIMDVVIGLNVSGVHTFASCEGHLEWGCANPWVDVRSEVDVSESVAEARKLHLKVEAEAEKLTEEEKEKLMLESNQILEKAALPNLQERMKLMILLNDFYNEHQALFDV